MKQACSRYLRRPFILAILCAVIFSLLLSGCTSAPAPEKEAEPPAEIQTTDETEALSPAEKMLEDMTLREKVGQLFIIRPESLNEDWTPEDAHDYTQNGDTTFTEAIAEKLAQYPAGGIAIFGKNITDPAQLSKLIEDYRGASKTPLLFCIDEEGGLVARLANTETFELPQYPAAAEIATQGEEAVREMGKTIGAYLADCGVNVDFAPVADVNSNPDNPVIGTRSFSSEPDEVTAMVTAFLEGLHSENVFGCIKHFPGHGDTDSDTHTGAVVLNKTWEDLLACELIPFRDTMANADMIMTAHINLPQITGDDTPATMSYTILTEKLRGELGYEGIIVTDALAMGAIIDHYTSSEAAIKSFLAGADILLMPWDYAEAFEGVLAAVEDGTISEERLDESVLRILELKEKTK